ncbi:MAG: ribose-phosphate pyrophosphokinase [Sphingobacteriales bacterium]|nr:MAG: ribose-phosphate pyrophosphokinase [Sphingobacteriales bacterium]
MSSQIMLFGGRTSKTLSEEIAQHYDLPLINVQIQQFSDGEIQPVIKDSVRGEYVFFIQSTNPPSENIMELMLLIDAARRASAKYITAVIPYFGYARQDRKDKPRVPIAAKLIANLLTTAGANRVMTMDLHAPQIQGFFDIPVDHLDSSAVFIPYIREIGSTADLLFASPDVGGTKRARSFAKYFKTDMVICDKYREKANEIAGMTVIGDVEGRDVVLVDDIVDTAGTLCNAAQALLAKGANSVRAICTHPVLSGAAYERIESSLLTELVVCNTLPLKQTSKKIRVLSVAPLFATAIKRTFEHRSISSLFS